jgi:hypothetical protein
MIVSRAHAEAALTINFGAVPANVADLRQPIGLRHVRAEATARLAAP